MLVMKRKVGERIYIGPNVVVEITKISGKQVTLAIDAPSHIEIFRTPGIKPSEPNGETASDVELYRQLRKEAYGAL